MSFQRYRMFGIPLSFFAVALSVALASGAVFYFYYSPIYQKDVTVLGADIFSINPNWDQYSTNTTEITNFVSLTDLKEGGGTHALDDVVLIAVKNDSAHNMGLNDMELRISVDKPDSNLIVTVTMYWVAYWESSVPEDITTLFIKEASVEIAPSASSGDLLRTISNADWTGKMVYHASQVIGTEPTAAGNHGLLLDFDFSRDGASWGDHTINVQIYVGIDE